MPKAKDPLATNLDNTIANRPGRKYGRLDTEFRHRPEVLESIRKARGERNLSFQLISEVISEGLDTPISATAVQNWCRKEGIYD